jgi:hypothetical protein
MPVIQLDGPKVYDGSPAGLRASRGAPRTLIVDLAVSMYPITVDGATVVRVEGPRHCIYGSGLVATSKASISA